MILSLDAGAVPNVRLVGHVNYKEPWIHFKRAINEFVAYIIKSGEMYIQEGKVKYVLKKGDFLLLEPDIPHAGYAKAPCDYYYIHFKHPLIKRVEGRSKDEILHEMLEKRRQSLFSDYLSENPPTEMVCYFPKHITLENDSEYILLLQNAVEEFYRMQENYKRMVSVRFLELLIKICQDFVTVNAANTKSHYKKAFIKAQSVLTYINEEYRRKITIKDIEERFGSNYDYLNRVFNKMTGYTISNYINVIRINKAKELIATTQMKFCDIGYLVGVEDPYYFSKLFKKIAGMSPTQYWEKTRKLENLLK